MFRPVTEAAVTPSPEERLGAILRQGGGPLAVAESCTGGLIAHRITDIAGCSAYFDRGVVVYSNQAKTQLLGVPGTLIESHGAVSEECAVAMLQGLMARSPARLAAAVTGIAGPEGGSVNKPVGTVWVAWGTRADQHTECLHLHGVRSEIKSAAADLVLHRLLAMAEGNR